MSELFWAPLYRVASGLKSQAPACPVQPHQFMLTKCNMLKHYNLCPVHVVGSKLSHMFVKVYSVEQSKWVVALSHSSSSVQMIRSVASSDRHITFVCVNQMRTFPWSSKFSMLLSNLSFRSWVLPEFRGFMSAMLTPCSSTSTSSLYRCTWLVLDIFVMNKLSGIWVTPFLVSIRMNNVRCAL